MSPYSKRGALSTFDVTAAKADLDALIDGPALGAPELALIERTLQRYPGPGMPYLLEKYALSTTERLKKILDGAEQIVQRVHDGRMRLTTCKNGWNSAARLRFIGDLLALRAGRERS